ncbi:MAG: hypothetical protein OZSIB_0379 [Candidatus Ozemobacter sibiricus]|uniref:Tetratricopeptide repeat protein n=1 Tax=Candidatus Ozemobacter sibiricus TaxID=2268124 RepID=A0A367ZMG3_9BACT|nr:MAG: hypothetical protein OZSIB_0379 [Candidatus Ozemobacter sibiricus]
MAEPVDRIDLSDIRWFVIGCVLLLLPLLTLIIRHERDRQEAEFSTQAIESRSSAFDLLPTRPAPTEPGRRPGAAPTPASPIEGRQDVIAAELDKAWSVIRATPPKRQFPPEMAPEAVQMSLAAEDPALIEGNANLDAGDLTAAEAHFRQALDHAADNPFLALEAYGGLMETYKRQQRLDEFIKAFKAYALAAQRLKHVYGPFADNIARASDMLEQLARVDPGRLREELVKGNLALGTKVDLDQFLQAIEKTRQLFPTDLPLGEAGPSRTRGG